MSDGIGGDPRHFADGKGFVDLSSWLKIAVSGAGALSWLNQQLAVDVGDLAPGRAHRSHLLSADGEVLAELTVALPGGNLLLLQDPAEPHSLWDLLSARATPDVELEDRTDHFALFAFPGRSIPPAAPGTAFSSPSCVGSGVDVIALAEDHARVRSLLERMFVPASARDLAAWRSLESKGGARA